MRSVYALKLNVRTGKYGKRPTSSTPIEPMLIPLGDSEVLAVCASSDLWAPEITEGNWTAKSMLDLDPNCEVTMEVRPNGKTHECVLTITMPLE